jgi:hypothetical protein
MNTGDILDKKQTAVVKVSCAANIPYTFLTKAGLYFVTKASSD